MDYDFSVFHNTDDWSALKLNDKSKCINKPDDFYENHLGMITGSEFGYLIVKSKDRKEYVLSNNKTAEDLIYKTAWERLLKQGNISNGLGRLNIHSSSLEHGNEYEQEAILKYMQITGNDVDYTQRFIQIDSFIGGTPDGLIGDDGIIEVKCPWNGGNHIRSLLTREVYNPKYIYQIQGYLWITERLWCDFVTYDPDLCDYLQLNIIRIGRDEEIISGIQSVMNQVKNKITEIMENRILHGKIG